MDNAQRARLSRALREVFYTVLQRRCEDEFSEALQKTKRQIRIAGRELLPPQTVDFSTVEWTINGIAPRGASPTSGQKTVMQAVRDRENSPPKRIQ